MPIRSMRLRPNQSDRMPKSSWPRPWPKKKMATTHCRWLALATRSERPMAGRAGSMASMPKAVIAMTHEIRAANSGKDKALSGNAVIWNPG